MFILAVVGLLSVRAHLKRKLRKRDRATSHNTRKIVCSVWSVVVYIISKLYTPSCANSNKVRRFPGHLLPLQSKLQQQSLSAKREALFCHKAYRRRSEDGCRRGRGHFQGLSRVDATIGIRAIEAFTMAWTSSVKNAGLADMMSHRVLWLRTMDSEERRRWHFVQVRTQTDSVDESHKLFATSCCHVSIDVWVRKTIVEMLLPIV